jgi:hypothetical protein
MKVNTSKESDKMKYFMQGIIIIINDFSVEKMEQNTLSALRKKSPGNLE